MSQLIQHYQTSFEIRGIDQNKMLNTIQEVVASWVSDIENKRYSRLRYQDKTAFKLKKTWNSFKKRTSLRSKHSWCTTNYCIMEDSTAWVMEYTHRDQQENYVFWVTEIGVRTFNAGVIVCIKLSNKLLTEFMLTGKSFNPDVTIPRCVKNILLKFQGAEYKILSGGLDVTSKIGMYDPVVVQTNEEIEKLRSYVYAENRKFAVVILRGKDYPGVQEEAKYLCKNLFAKAIVYVVGQNFNKIGRHNLEYGDCIFLPPLKYNSPIRYTTPESDEDAKQHKEECRQRIKRAWLGTQPIHEDGAVCSLEDINYWIRFTQYKVETAKVQELQEGMQSLVPPEKHEELKKKFEEIQQSLREQGEAFKKEKKTLEERNFELELEKEELEIANLNLEIEKDEALNAEREKLYNVTATYQSQMRKSTSVDYVLPKEFPNSFENLQKFEKFYQHLAFAEDAWQSAFEYKKFSDWETAWEMLHDLNLIAWKLIFEVQGCDIEHEFASQSRFKYAKGEGRQTNKNAKLAQIRTFQFEGKTWEMWPHIKAGNQDGKQLRIHFAIDHSMKRLIVGYIGSHMDNASTRNLH